ncbi:MFS general substrate transporter [Auricularia subglabra TFB-10046 SS5]|nr:MFS general substrate transporter [Auricularia subglabra TFB-10046 SS5]
MTPPDPLAGMKIDMDTTATATAEDPLVEFTAAERRSAWRKVDLHVLPVAILLYIASYIDRANIGNARVLGLADDLNLTSGQYNWALSIFFVGYVLLETPSNILLRRVRPSVYIPCLTMVWSLISGLHATVRSPTGLLAVRFALGVAEAGYVPGAVFWLACWYPRSMLGRRFAYLFTAVSITGACGGLLATAIYQLDGVRGIAGWRWIFIVEGALSALVGVAAFLLMADYPASARWLDGRERAYVLLANEADRAQLAAEPFERGQILSAFRDWRVYVWGVVFLCTNAPSYSVILSLPSVVAGLGYTGVHATLLACPPYAFSLLLVLAAGWSVDRHGHRYAHHAAACALAIIALVVLMVVESLAERYAMFFLVMFMLVPISTTWGWLSGNVAGANKRAAATGFVLSVGTIGGAISGQVYREEWAPRYVRGHAVNVGFYTLALLAGGVLWWSYRRDNMRRDKLELGDGGAVSDKDEGVVEMREGVGGTMLGERLGDLGDRHPKFRYLL